MNHKRIESFTDYGHRIGDLVRHHSDMHLKWYGPCIIKEVRYNKVLPDVEYLLFSSKTLDTSAGWSYGQSLYPINEETCKMDENQLRREYVRERKQRNIIMKKWHGVEIEEGQF